MKNPLDINVIIALGVTFFGLSASLAQEREANNPVLKLNQLHAENEKWVVKITNPISIYRSPAAQSIRAVLLQNQAIDVLEMNRFGLHVRGRTKNGFASGWAGWKQVLDDDNEKLEMLEVLRKRQLEVMPLLEIKRPAVGMTYAELKWMLGPPTSTQTKTSEGKKTQTLHWARKKMVDVSDVLGQLAVLTRERELEVDAGSITAELVNGVAYAIRMDLTNGDNEVAVVNPPGELPFVAVINPKAYKKNVAKRTP